MHLRPLKGQRIREHIPIINEWGWQAERRIINPDLAVVLLCEMKLTPKGESLFILKQKETKISIADACARVQQGRLGFPQIPDGWIFDFFRRIKTIEGKIEALTLHTLNDIPQSDDPDVIDNWIRGRVSLLQQKAPDLAGYVCYLLGKLSITLTEDGKYLRQYYEIPERVCVDMKCIKRMGGCDVESCFVYGKWDRGPSCEGKDFELKPPIIFTPTGGDPRYSIRKHHP